MRIKEAIRFGEKELNNYKIEDAFLKSKMLICYVINKPKEYLIINGDKELSPKEEDYFINYIKQVQRGKPVQYITHIQSFMNCEFYVDENVLIPQPDTEVLVQETLKLIGSKEDLTILDICTGSGAIIISLAKEKKGYFYGSDISKEAIKIACKNAKSNNVEIDFIVSDLFKNITKEKYFDIIVSNPPYIEKDTISLLPKEVQNEPVLALDGGEDGLKFYRDISEKAKNYLKSGGYLIFEIGYNQKKSVCEILEKAGYEIISKIKDYSGQDRVIVSRIER